MPDAECLYFGDTHGFPLNDFDSSMNAMMGISQIVTLDTWSQQMYDIMQAFSPHTRGSTSWRLC